MIAYTSVRKAVHAHEHVAFKCVGSHLWVKRKLRKLFIFFIYFKEIYTYLSRCCVLKKYLSVITLVTYSQIHFPVRILSKLTAFKFQYEKMFSFLSKVCLTGELRSSVTFSCSYKQRNVVDYVKEIRVPLTIFWKLWTQNLNHFLVRLPIKHAAVFLLR
jgi:hypothetical protein